jgi:hypothetical protein
VERAHDLLVEDADAAGSDGAHRQLGLLRGAEFADHEDIERRPEGLRDLVRDWNSAARKREDNGFITSALLIDEFAEVRSQPLPGVDAIGKQGGYPQAPEIARFAYTPFSQE